MSLSNTYFYLGDFTHYQTASPSGYNYAYPTQLANYNPYSPSNTSLPLVQNQSQDNVAFMTYLSQDNVSRVPAAITATMVVAPNQSLFMYVGGGVAGFYDTIGVGISANRDTLPSFRYVLLSNAKSTTDGSSSRQGIVLGSLALPIPLE